MSKVINPQFLLGAALFAGSFFIPAAGLFGIAKLSATAVGGFGASLALSGATAAFTGDSLDLQNPAIDRKENFSSTVANGVYVYGCPRLGGQIVYADSHGEQSELMTMILVMAAEEVSQVKTIYLNGEPVNFIPDPDDPDVLIPDADSDYTKNGRPLIWIRPYLGTQTAADPYAVANLPEWTEDHIGYELTYFRVTLRYDREIFRTGRVTITADLQGKGIYDPRTGGNVFTDNAALVVAHYLSRPEGYDLGYGKIDMPTLIAAANICDIQIGRTDPDNPTGVLIEDAYSLNGVFSSGKRVEILQSMLLCMAGDVVVTGGIWKILPGAVQLPVAALDHTMLLDAQSFEMDPDAGFDGRINTVSGDFFGKEHNQHKTGYPIVKDATLLAIDGGQIERRIDYRWCNSAARAQRLATAEISASRAMIVWSGTFKMNAYFPEAGEVIEFSHPTYNWDRKQFRITRREYDVNQMTVLIEAREYNSERFDWTIEQEQRVSSTITPRFSNTPFAGGSATSDVITATEVGVEGNGEDEAETLNESLKRISSEGGGRVILKPLPVSHFFFNQAVQIPSNIHISFVGPPVRLGKLGTIETCGEICFEPGAIRLARAHTAGETVLEVDDASECIPGDTIRIRGAGGLTIPVEPREDVIVTAVNGNLITLLEPLENSYETVWTNDIGQAYTALTGNPDETLLAKVCAAQIVGPVNKCDQQLPVDTTRIGAFAPGDLVAVMDLKRVSDVAGISNNQMNVELAQIEDIAGNIVTLDHELTLSLDAAFNPTLVKINPARNARISDTTITYVEAPDPAPAPRVNAFQLRYAVNSSIDNCRTVITDGIRQRGNDFRQFWSYNCTTTNNVAAALPAGAAFEGGDAYGFTYYYSWGCSGNNNKAGGHRHPWLVQSASLCREDNFYGVSLLSGADFHGLNERHCHFDGDIVASASAPDTNTALVFGNTFHRAGSHHCTANVRAHGFKGQIGVRIEPPSTGCHATITGDEIGTICRIVPSDEDPTQQAVGCSVTAQFQRCAKGLEIDGDREGTADMIVDGFKFSGDIGTSGAPVKCQQAENVSIFNMFAEREDGQSIAVELDRCPGANVSHSKISNAKTGIRFEDCPNAWATHNTFCDITESAGKDGGNSPFLHWSHNAMKGPSSAGEFVSVGTPSANTFITTYDVNAGNDTPYVLIASPFTVSYAP